MLGFSYLDFIAGLSGQPSIQHTACSSFSPAHSTFQRGGNRWQNLLGNWPVHCYWMNVSLAYWATVFFFFFSLFVPALCKFLNEGPCCTQQSPKTRIGRCFFFSVLQFCRIKAWEQSQNINAEQGTAKFVSRTFFLPPKPCRGRKKIANQSQKRARIDGVSVQTRHGYARFPVGYGLM